MENMEPNECHERKDNYEKENPYFCPAFGCSDALIGMSFADIERRLAQLDEQFQQLLTEAIDAEDKEACNAQFAEILAEQTSLKRQKEAILQSSTDASRVCTRMKQAEQAIENTTQTITEWNENAVRQIVERVTVLSADEILVRIKGGAEIKQRLE